jgi:hypothetical protein
MYHKAGKTKKLIITNQWIGIKRPKLDIIKALDKLRCFSK